MGNSNLRLIEKGDELLASNKIEEAILKYNKAIEKNPSHANSYYRKGIAYLKKNDLQKALENFSNATKSNPNFVEAFYQEGIILLQLNQLQQAIISFDSAINNSKKNSIFEFYNFRGFAEMGLKNYDKCLTSFNKSLEICENPNSYYYKSKALYEMKNFNDSLHNINRAIELDHTNIEIKEFKGEILFYLMEYEQAKECFELIIKYDKNYIKAYLDKGRCLRKLKLYDQEIAFYKNTLNYLDKDEIYLRM